MNSVQAVLVKVLQALRPRSPTPHLQKYGQHVYRAGGAAIVVLMDGEYCRHVAALAHSNERNERGTGVRG